jgi:hypothetical protein
VPRPSSLGFALTSPVLATAVAPFYFPMASSAPSDGFDAQYIDHRARGESEPTASLGPEIPRVLVRFCYGDFDIGALRGVRSRGARAWAETVDAAEASPRPHHQDPRAVRHADPVNPAGGCGGGRGELFARDSFFWPHDAEKIHPTQGSQKAAPAAKGVRAA